MRRFLPILAVLVALGAATASSRASEPPRLLQRGPFAVGFRSVVARDATRPAYGSAAAHGGRPVQISLWYPAQANLEAARMPYSAYLFLGDRERSLDAWSDEELRDVLEERVTRAARDGADAAAFRERWLSPAAAVLRAPPAAGRFPLIVFSPSMLGSPLSNVLMCELLASHGYVVAAHPSAGLTAEFMTTALHDLDRQARDVESVIAMLAAESNVDSERTAVLGHSWGALAGLLAASRDPRIGVVVSLDGSEEMWRDVLDRSAGFEPALFTTPYLRFHKPKSANDPDHGLFDSIRHAPTYRVVLDPGVQHFEFVSSRAFASWLRGDEDQEEKFQTLALISRHVLAFLAAFVNGDENELRLLWDERAGRELSPPLLAIGRGPNLPPVPTDLEFLSLVVEQGQDEALARYREEVAADPDSFSERRTVRLGEMLLWTARHDDAAIRLLELGIQRFPNSARAFEMLGNVYYWNRGEAEAALPLYEKALALDPHNLQVRTYIEQIRGD